MSNEIDELHKENERLRSTFIALLASIRIELSGRHPPNATETFSIVNRIDKALEEAKK